MKSLIVIWVLVIACLFGWHVAFAASDKYDGDCPQPYTTVGRCADKCPNQTDTLQGYDKETGAAICKAAPTGCPYGDSVPLGPDCDRLAPQPAQPPQDVVTPVEGFAGK